MIYNNLNKTIQAIVEMDMANTINTATDAVGNSVKAANQQQSQFNSLGELLLSETNFEKQCDFIFSSNDNYNRIASEMGGYIRLRNADEFINKIKQGFDPDKAGKIVAGIAERDLKNIDVLRRLAVAVTDDIAKIPNEARNKWTMAAQHVKDTIVQAAKAGQGPKPTAPTQTPTGSVKPIDRTIPQGQQAQTTNKNNFNAQEQSGKIKQEGQ